MRFKFSKVFLAIFIAIFVCFLLRGHVTEDPDFGWHIQAGQLFAEKGIPREDPFSYTMPSYYFVNHEWLADILIAKIYNAVGLWPLQILFALFGLLTILLLLKGVDRKWVMIPMLMAAGTLLEFIGVRMQVITWVFLALLSAIIFQKTMWHRWMYVLPVFFFVWANVHGGFAIGIVILTIYLVGKSIEERAIDWKQYGVLLGSIFATLLNPYGYHLWIEVTKSLTDTSLRWAIQEWHPAIYFTNIAFWIYFSLSVFLLIRYWKKFSPTIIILYTFLLLSGLASMRNIPVFVIFSFFVTMQSIGYLAKEAAKHKYGLERFAKAYTVLLVVSLVFFLSQLGMFFYGAYVQDRDKSPYPSGAVAFLKENPPEGNIFATYDWGGYLIWKLPEKRVFIDGRMPSWRNPDAPENESTYAYGDYKKILTGKASFAQAAIKYNIDTVIFPRDELEPEKVYFMGIEMDKDSFYRKLFTSEMSFSYLTPQIDAMGWEEVYRDDFVVIFQKPKSWYQHYSMVNP